MVELAVGSSSHTDHTVTLWEEEKISSVLAFGFGVFSKSLSANRGSELPCLKAQFVSCDHLKKKMFKRKNKTDFWLLYKSLINADEKRGFKARLEVSRDPNLSHCKHN